MNWSWSWRAFIVYHSKQDQGPKSKGDNLLSHISQVRINWDNHFTTVFFLIKLENVPLHVLADSNRKTNHSPQFLSVTFKGVVTLSFQSVLDVTPSQNTVFTFSALRSKISIKVTKISSSSQEALCSAQAREEQFVMCAPTPKRQDLMVTHSWWKTHVCKQLW